MCGGRGVFLEEGTACVGIAKGFVWKELRGKVSHTEGLRFSS